MEPRKKIFALLAEGVHPSKIEILLVSGEKATLQQYADCMQLYWLIGGSENATHRIEAVQVIPDTIEVNGFKVPAPMVVEPDMGDRYFTPDLARKDFAQEYRWRDDEYDFLFLSREIIHSTRENAVAHAKAMLGIDPSK